MLLSSVPALLSCGAKTGLRVPFRDASAVDAFDAGQPPPRTYLGTEFWAVSTTNHYIVREYRFDFAVAVGNPNDVPVTVTVTGGRLPAPTTATIQPHQTGTFVLPWVDALAQRASTTVQCLGEPIDHDIGSAQVLNGAYRIQASAPVNAYQFNPLQYQVGASGCVNHSYTNDASLLLPTEAIGVDYLALTYRTPRSFIAIVGTQETPTTVEITPRGDITEGASVTQSGPGVPRRFTLTRGEVVQLLSSGDLSGSVMHASAPVAVFVGSDCTFVSWPDDGEAACDHLEEQLFPSDTWGSEVVVSQLRDRTADEGNVIRIISREDGNRLAFTPAGAYPSVTLARGEVITFESHADFVVRGTQPLLVAQFMEGQQTTPGFDMGDPAMVFEVPALQYLHEYSFVVPASYTSSSIQVTAAAGATVLLDGVSIATTPDPIPGTSWVVFRRRIAPGSHTLTTNDPAGAGLKVVGVANFTSYMYPGGLGLAEH